MIYVVSCLFLPGDRSCQVFVSKKSQKGKSNSLYNETQVASESKIK